MCFSLHRVVEDKTSNKKPLEKIGENKIQREAVIILRQPPTPITHTDNGINTYVFLEYQD